MSEIVKNYYKDKKVTDYPEDINFNLLNNYEYIDKKVYEEIMQVLEQIHNFGEKDDDEENRWPNIENQLNLLKGDIVTTDFYNDIAKRVDDEDLVSQYELIFNESFDGLKDYIKSLDIPSTRYYETTKSCCSCDGYTGADCCMAYVRVCYDGASCMSQGCSNVVNSSPKYK